MGYLRLTVMLLALFLPLAHADVCAKPDILGAYGFHMSGAPTIAGSPVPSAVIGRLVLDNDGKVAGYSSVNFNGVFLGNPVTGTWQLNSDCTVGLALQDDSGGWQHFTGTLARSTQSVDLRQTDTGARSRGTLQRVPAGCNTQSLQGHYAVTLSGGFSETGTVESDGAGNLNLTWSKGTRTGTYSVDGECFVQFEFAVAQHDGGPDRQVKMRGVIVNGGKEVTAVQNDPERVTSARFLK